MQRGHPITMMRSISATSRMIECHHFSALLLTAAEQANA
jgi:hypothetical protein